MTTKHIKFSDDAWQSLASGADILANAVKATLGPRGRNVIIEKSYGAPVMTKDGVTVAMEIVLEDKFENMGVDIAMHAMQRPLREIVANAGEDASVVLNKVKEGGANFGYNAQTQEYGDMLEMGIIDPTKVVRVALQNAASIAALMITT